MNDFMNEENLYPTYMVTKHERNSLLISNTFPNFNKSWTISSKNRKRKLVANQKYMLNIFLVVLLCITTPHLVSVLYNYSQYFYVGESYLQTIALKFCVTVFLIHSSSRLRCN